MKIIKEAFHRRFPRVHERLVTGLWPRLQDALLAGALRRRLAQRLAQTPFPPPHKVEIEIFNRCNNDCPFCPVNSTLDPRKAVRMTDELFESILKQLAEMGFEGRLALHSNNEPLLDRRIERFARTARDRLPRALIYLQTNGILLTVERFAELMRSLDRIVINNYADDLRMIPPVEAVWRYCREHESVRNRVTIHLKRKHIIRSNRAGTAPNAAGLSRPMRSPCLRPFFEMIIRPDGKVSLCCFDARGATTVGDAVKSPIREIWQGEMLMKIRRQMVADRSGIALCKPCDEVIIGEHLFVVERHGTLRNLGRLAKTILSPTF